MSDTPIGNPAASGDDWWLGVDIGGTRAKFGVVSPGGQVRQTRTETTSHEPFERIWEMLLGYAREVAAASGTGRFRGAGVAAPGLVDPIFGVRNLPGKVPGIEGFPLRARLEEALGVPVRCVNDGAAATLAEWRFGAAAGHRDVVGLTIGTGLGCGVIIDDRLLISGHLGAGISFGHATIDTAGRTCLCGNIGCAESLVSANALVGQVRDYVSRKVPSVLTERFEAKPEEIGLEDLVEAYVASDRVAVEIMRAFQRHLGATIVTAIHAYDPEIVVLAGGPLAAADHFLPEVQSYVDTYSFRYPKDRIIPIVRAERSDHAGVLGAVALVMQLADDGHLPQETT
ncbi:MAG: ROK family protein [Chloroflexota bacterium]